ncbi:MAG TPA: enoyl-CoA hydratase-related protein [Halioglobus sp.]
MTFVLTAIQDGIATLTLNLPELHNPISDPSMVDALVAALAGADAEPAVRVIILTGAGKSFCSGGNIKTMLPDSPHSLAHAQPALTPGNYRRGIQRIPLLFEQLQKPVIAAVNGAAMGAGCDLACMCDIRIAASSARFAENFVKLGLSPGDGGAWLLQRVVGYSKAAEMALTGDTLDAEQALACGLVSRVVPDDQLLNEARKLASRIAANPPLAVQQAKRLLMQGRQGALAPLLESAAAVQALLHTTEEHREAVEAFSKRGPK